MIKRTRIRYWSHSWLTKLTAKWLGAPRRPPGATMKEWRDFDRNQKHNFPLQENIEDFLSWLQNVVLFPSDVVYTIRCYIRNRFIDKIHVLQTDLEPGQYYDYDSRLLHGMFNSFVQFIEHEQTLENLKWELTLTNEYEWLCDEEAKQQPDYGKATPQAISAQEKLALYTWWKETRPARVDAYEASGYKDWSSKNRNEEDGMWSTLIDDEDTEKQETRSTLFKKWREIDDQYDKEDEDMMIRLIRIRQTCWT